MVGWVYEQAGPQWVHHPSRCHAVAPSTRWPHPVESRRAAPLVRSLVWPHPVESRRAAPLVRSPVCAARDPSARRGGSRHGSTGKSCCLCTTSLALTSILAVAPTYPPTPLSSSKSEPANGYYYLCTDIQANASQPNTSAETAKSYMAKTEHATCNDL